VERLALLGVVAFGVALILAFAWLMYQSVVHPKW